jgi:HSP20 family protein
MSEKATVAPFVDVYENTDELLIVADVPGATQDGVSIHFDKGELSIEAKRSEVPSGSPLLSEHRPCDYFRAFSVPQGIDASKIDAQLRAGVLRVRLPKSDAVKPRRIEVKTA